MDGWLNESMDGSIERASYVSAVIYITSYITRLGQYRPIFATRFIIENTIEERILRLQEKKKLVFDGTVGGDSSSMAKLTVDDMRFLFQ